MLSRDDMNGADGQARQAGGSIVQIDADASQIDAWYRKELRWPHALRVNLDARLLMLGLHRLRCALQLSDAEFRALGFVVGCRLGAMESYEAFERSLAQRYPAPLSFTHALPSIPLACASLHFRLQGQTLTLAGDADVGVRALAQAALLVRAGRCARAVAGCWETPSDTARTRHRADERCRLLLALVDGSGGSICGPAPPQAADDGPVAQMARHLLRCRLPSGPQHA